MSNVATLPAATRAVSIDFNDPVAVYLDADIFGQLQRVAKLMSSASLVPAHLRGEQKLGDCFLVAAQAFRWRMDPFSVAQHTYVVSGKLGYEGKLIAGIINSSGKLVRSLSYTFGGEGDARTVTVSGTLKGEDTPREIIGTLVGWKTANAKWKEMPDQMLTYRGAREWARRHMPEAVLGIHGDDEISEPSQVNMRDVTPAAAVTAALAQLPEQEADTPATAESDSGSPSLAGVVPAPTVALPDHLEARAQTIRNAIAAARTVKDLDRIMIAQRGTMDDITGVDAAAGEALMQAMRDRVAAVGAA